MSRGKFRRGERLWSFNFSVVFVVFVLFVALTTSTTEDKFSDDAASTPVLRNFSSMRYFRARVHEGRLLCVCRVVHVGELFALAIVALDLWCRWRRELELRGSGRVQVVKQNTRERDVAKSRVKKVVVCLRNENVHLL
jgi:hypothetical protein